MNRRLGFLAAGLLVTLLVAGGLSRYASSAPDGLDRVARDTGIAKAEKRHAQDGSPFAGYTADWLPDGPLAGAVAGVGGVLVTLALAGGVFALVRRRGADVDARQRGPSSPSGPSGPRG